MDRGGENVSVSVRQLSAVSRDWIGYESRGPNQHVIVFRDREAERPLWEKDDADVEHLEQGPPLDHSTIALTTVSFDTVTGEIFDADMEINSANYDFSVGDSILPGQIDLQTVVTHEAGHFLGLAHSLDPNSPMQASVENSHSFIRLLDDTQPGHASSARPATRSNQHPRGAVEFSDPSTELAIARVCDAIDSDSSRRV
jgi:hypothetical protein